MNRSIFKKKTTIIALGLTSIILASTVFLLPASAQQIIIDGQTQTSLNTNGSTTNVTTSTIRGNNAYNSFKKFNVDQNNTVNLHVPDKAQNLINLIYDEATNINGTLNGLKNDQIGGNIFLINPHGITVGTQGVINVGSLTAVTPDKREMEFFRIDSDEAQNFDFKAMNTNPDAVISINGQINAISDVFLAAGRISISGKIEAGKQFPKEDKKDSIGISNSFMPQGMGFGSIVNIGSMKTQPDVAILQKAGNIKIQSENSIYTQNAKLLTNKGNISLNSYNGHVTGYGKYEGNLSIFGKEIHLTNIDGDLNIKLAQSCNGKINLWSMGGILPSTGINPNLILMGNDITLGALTGDIGTPTEPLRIFNINKTPIMFTAHTSRGSMYISNINNNDLLIRKAEAYDKVDISSYGNIFDGNKISTLHNIEADFVKLYSDGSIGTYKDPLKIKPASYFKHYSPDTAISVKAVAKNEIVLEQDQFNMKADSIISRDSNVWLTTRNGSILDGSNHELVNIEGNNIALTAQRGSIGTKYEDLNINLKKGTGNSIDAVAYDGDINITQNNGDLPIGVITSGHDVKITADNNILDGNTNGYTIEQPSILSKNLVLISNNGSIGEFREDLDIQCNRLDSGGSLTAIAPNGIINIEQHSDDLYINTVIAGKEVFIKSQEGIYSNTPYENIDIIGRTVSLFAGTSIGTDTDSLGIKSDQTTAQSYKDKYIKLY